MHEVKDAEQVSQIEDIVWFGRRWFELASQ